MQAAHTPGRRAAADPSVRGHLWQPCCVLCICKKRSDCATTEWCQQPLPHALWPGRAQHNRACAATHRSSLRLRAKALAARPSGYAKPSARRRPGRGPGHAKDGCGAAGRRCSQNGGGHAALRCCCTCGVQAGVWIVGGGQDCVGSGGGLSYELEALGGGCCLCASGLPSVSCACIIILLIHVAPSVHADRCGKKQIVLCAKKPRGRTPAAHTWHHHHKPSPGKARQPRSWR